MLNETNTREWLKLDVLKVLLHEDLLAVRPGNEGNLEKK
jgi:hypothetical protein